MTSRLAPGFLVAAPDLSDPNFASTTVLLCVHNADGALGFVINRRAEGVDLPGVLNAVDIPHGALPDVPVLYGGPVRPEAGWLIYDPRSLSADFEVATADPAGPGLPESTQVETADGEAMPGALAITPTLHVTSSRAHLEALARGLGPDRANLVLGYAGWGPQQLEAEIAAGAWMHSDLDEGLLYDCPIEERWTRALANQGINPALLNKAAVDA